MVGSLRNTNIIPRRWKYLNILDLMLPTYIILSIPLFYMGLHYDFVFKCASVIVSLVYIIKFPPIKTPNTYLFSVFFLVVTFSFIQYAYNSRPIALYISDVSNYLLAMLFFYVGVSDDRPGRPFYNKLMISIASVFFLGLICFVTMPSWFLSRTIEAINTDNLIQYDETNVFEQMRFGAFWGDSYSVSHLSVFCVAAALFSIAYCKGKKRILPLLCLFVGLVSSIASMHRASMAGSAIAIMLYVYFNHRTHRRKDNVTVFVVASLVLISFLLLLPRFGDRMVQISELVFNRVDDNMSLSTALQERKYTNEVMSSMRFFIFGHGLGAGGVGARAYGFAGISDMQYIKMFYENGIIGAFLFVVIIFRALKRGIIHISTSLTELIVISFILVAMLGSNSLSIYYFIVFPFWYATGRLINNKHLNCIQ